jgi:threonine dehydrogenase-like Zn-dependent dehydrogenase
MKALVYHGPGNRAWESVPDPTIQEPTDIVVKIDARRFAAPISTSSRETCPR